MHQHLWFLLMVHVAKWTAHATKSSSLIFDVQNDSNFIQKVLFEISFWEWEGSKNYSEELWSKSSLKTRCLLWQHRTTCSSCWRLCVLSISFDIKGKRLITPEKIPDLFLGDEVSSFENFSTQQRSWKKYHNKPHSISIWMQNRSISTRSTADLKVFHDNCIWAKSSFSIVINSRQMRILIIFLWAEN